ncbi:PREDICTED: uncharacterized protein LOC109131320 [Camelina sativa]|uniref:Uncharacterized protein LOC109131320 n=1 Tax=Camelina sativa TaxID=90675 RepID=A0ABM1RF92_CAMSA|nr:PREDICTED: uncharacterized protein LOC109131320 [Camelina sativa]
MISNGSARDGLSVIGLSRSGGHGDLDMMVLLTNLWLGLSLFWVSTRTTMIAYVTPILAVRDLFPLHRGVIVRVMMIKFIHDVFPSMLGLLDLTTMIVDSVLFQIYGPRHLWVPGIKYEALIVKIYNDVFDVEGIIGWDYISSKRNSLIHTRTPIRTNWYRIVGISKLFPQAMGFFYVMWSFKQRMSIRHTYHIQVRWLMKKGHNMFNNMIASKAYGTTKHRQILFFMFCYLQYMAHISAYVIICFVKFCICYVPAVIPY